MDLLRLEQTDNQARSIEASEIDRHRHSGKILQTDKKQKTSN